MGANLATFVITHPLFYCIIGAYLSLLAVEVLVTIITVGAAKVMDLLVGVVLDAILALLFGAIGVLTGFIFGGSETISGLLGKAGMAIAFVDFAVILALMFTVIWAREKLGGVVRGIVGVTLATLGLVAVLAGSDEDPYVDLYSDIVGIGLGLKGAMESYKGKEDTVSFVGKIGDVFSYASLGLDLAIILSKDYEV